MDRLRQRRVSAIELNPVDRALAVRVGFDPLDPALFQQFFSDGAERLFKVFNQVVDVFNSQ